MNQTYSTPSLLRPNFIKSIIYNPTMNVIGITGGTGFVGKHLADLLLGKGYEVIIFTRSAHKSSRKENLSYAQWDAQNGLCDIDALQKLDAAINLAGAGIADKRWTGSRKQEIRDSRVKGTDFLVEQLQKHAPNCKTFIAASATGFYGPDHAGAIPFTEDAPHSNDFLGNTCSEWEAASQKAAAFARTVILRFGIVLGKESGAFPKLAQPLSFGIMPILGSGRQMVSWIEIHDLARLIVYMLEQGNLSGIYNAVAQNPVTHLQLMKTIAYVKGGIKIPAPAPAFLLKLILGEMSEEVLKSSTVSAQKTTETGFQFNHEDILTTVMAICLQS
jgi:uncharacterized protein